MNESLLLVDDDPVFAETLSRALGRRGFDVSIAGTLDAALAETRSRQFDHILLDLMLGDDSTLNSIGTLLETQRDARLVVLTGYASIPTTVRALKLGATNYLAKPVGVREVLAALADDPKEPEPGVDTARAMPLKRLEWEHIQRVLDEHDGNISAAARALGVHRRSLQRKLSKKPPNP